jgi:hypothetical protein
MRRMDAVAADDRGDIGPTEEPLMAITLGKRFRSRHDIAPARSLDDVAQAERAAMTALAETLRQLVAGLPGDSKLAAEFTSVARSIDVAGVLGTWRLHALLREIGEDTE